MTDRLVRIATRKSPLAIWQAEHVAAMLRQAHPGVTTELVEMSTKGDRILDAPLAKVGGKGLFVKELEQGMLDGRADIAVHSMKDVPVEFPEGLHLAVIMQREDPRDAWVSNDYPDFSSFPPDGRIGTSSLRRQSQLLLHYPEARIGFLRGNVNTRLAKLDSGEFDAIVLAAAGLKRLKFDDRIALELPPEVSLPAIGQGAIGIECRQDDLQLNELLAALHDEATTIRLAAERALNTRLQGGCQVPIAGYAEIEGDELWLRGLVASPDGKTAVRGERRGALADAARMGTDLAEELLANGAAAILKAVGL